MSEANSSPDEPPPRSISIPADLWSELRTRPELACVEAWSQACRSWWLDEADPRLRDAALGHMGLSADELTGWLAQRPDRAWVIRAHGHVTAMRVGLEREPESRHLATGALRSEAVVSHGVDGTVRFLAASEVPAELERFLDGLGRVPSHPFLRVAFLKQGIGGIHPFRDANGGTARFLASVELARAGLPPFALSLAMRKGEYIDALNEGHRGRLDRLAMLTADVVHRGVADLLLTGRIARVAWDAISAQRASRWCDVIDRVWRSLTGEPEGARRTDAVTADARGDVLARLVRRGYRVPAEPGPRCARWSSASAASPLPVHLDAAFSPVRAGAATWLLAVVAGSAGERGELAAVDLGADVASSFVAVDGETDAVADARFERWAEARLARYARGLAHWM